jgi:hypothetical protein
MMKRQRKYWLLVGNCNDYYKCSKHTKQNNSKSNKIQKQTKGHAEHKVPHTELVVVGLKFSAA